MVARKSSSARPAAAVAAPLAARPASVRPRARDAHRPAAVHSRASGESDAVPERVVVLAPCRRHSEGAAAQRAAVRRRRGERAAAEQRTQLAKCAHPPSASPVPWRCPDRSAARCTGTRARRDSWRSLPRLGASSASARSVEPAGCAPWTPGRPAAKISSPALFWPAVRAVLQRQAARGRDQSDRRPGVEGQPRSEAGTPPTGRARRGSGVSRCRVGRREAAERG